MGRPSPSLYSYMHFISMVVTSTTETEQEKEDLLAADAAFRELHRVIEVSGSWDA